MPTKPKSAVNKSHFEITNTTKARLPRLAFVDMKDAVLGKNYDLSFVIVGDARSRALNRSYRNKNKPTNVLSFPLSKHEGEMFLNLKKAQREMKDFGMSYKAFIAYLFIHGLLHLKGLDHGPKMEKLEKKFLKQFEF